MYLDICTYVFKFFVLFCLLLSTIFPVTHEFFFDNSRGKITGALVFIRGRKGKGTGTGTRNRSYYSSWQLTIIGFDQGIFEKMSGDTKETIYSFFG